MRNVNKSNFKNLRDSLVLFINSIHETTFKTCVVKSRVEVRFQKKPVLFTKQTKHALISHMYCFTTILNSHGHVNIL